MPGWNPVLLYHEDIAYKSRVWMDELSRWNHMEVQNKCWSPRWEHDGSSSIEKGDDLYKSMDINILKKPLNESPSVNKCTLTYRDARDYYILTKNTAPWVPQIDWRFQLLASHIPIILEPWSQLQAQLIVPTSWHQSVIPNFFIQNFHDARWSRYRPPRGPSPRANNC